MTAWRSIQLSSACFSLSAATGWRTKSAAPCRQAEFLCL